MGSNTACSSPDLMHSGAKGSSPRIIIPWHPCGSDCQEEQRALPYEIFGFASKRRNTLDWLSRELRPMFRFSGA